jgi:peptidoglycan hydrolase CwlO-like protein
MNKFYIAVLICIFMCGTTVSLAQETKKQEVPVGMEIIEIGKAKVVVPKGLKVKKGTASVILESANEYVARRIWEMEQEIEEYKKQIEELRQEVDQLKKSLEDIKEGQHQQ